jgi:nitrous oxide reductase accessory protein NosL
LTGARRLGLALVAAALAAASGGSHALAGEPPIVPKPDDKCPVCGMFVGRYRDWVAGVRFADGGYAVFDGAEDLFRFLQGGARDERGRTAKDVVSAFVTDCYTLAQVDARTAVFVGGSDVLGPMGRELVPFASEPEARGFFADHRGRRLLRYGDVTPSALKELD